MPSIIRSPSAIAVGVFFSGVTAWVLLEDIFRHGAPVTTKHVMTLAVLAGTVYFGHALWRELRAWRLGTAFGCTVLFLAGTITCVLMSAGRNAEIVTNKVLAANSVNTARTSAAKDRDEAKTRYLAALKAEELECSDGQGEKCRSKRITTTLRRQDLDAAESKLREQKPEVIANSDIRAAAELVARLPYVTANVTAVEALLQLAFPFLQSLFCEIGAIVGFAIGLGHKARDAGRRHLPQPEPATPPATVPVTVPTVDSGWEPMSVEQAREKARNARAEAVFDALRQAGRPVSNDELAELIQKSKAESSRRSTYLDQAGLIQKHRQGRYVAISLRPLLH